MLRRKEEFFCKQPLQKHSTPKMFIWHQNINKFGKLIIFLLSLDLINKHTERLSQKELLKNLKLGSL